MLGEVTKLSRRFLEEKNTKPLRIIVYPNTEGIISSSILAKTFKKLNRKFYIRFSKRINQEISNQNQEEILILIDSRLEFDKNIRGQNLDEEKLLELFKTIIVY